MALPPSNKTTATTAESDSPEGIRPQTVSFDELPPEMRNRVYDEIILNDEDDWVDIFNNRIPSIAQINRSARQEFLSHLLNDKSLWLQLHGKAAVSRDRFTTLTRAAPNAEWFRVHGKAIMPHVIEMVQMTIKTYSQATRRTTWYYIAIKLNTQLEDGTKGCEVESPAIDANTKRELTRIVDGYTKARDTPYLTPSELAYAITVLERHLVNIGEVERGELDDVIDALNGAAL